jgi:hypothetical protein
MEQIPMPIGKYRNRPATNVLADRTYIEWMNKQPGIQERYPDVFNFLMFQTINPQSSKTPEHNKIQNLFLSRNFTFYFTVEVLKMRNFKFIKEVNSSFQEIERQRNVKLRCVEFEGIYNWDVITKLDLSYINGDDKEHYLPDFYVEIKPLLGDDYPEVLRKMKRQIIMTESKKKNEQNEDIMALGYVKEAQGWKQKEICGICDNKMECLEWVRDIINGESYKCEFVLLVDEFNSSTTSRDELVQIFNNERINVVFLTHLNVDGKHLKSLRNGL